MVQDNQEKIAHLGFIQSVITRMGTNSFLIKGWTVTLVAAMFALSAKDANLKISLLAYFPVLLFWVLDSFFLDQEKKFRELYDDVVNSTNNIDQFSMKTDYQNRRTISILCAMLSRTIWPFYFIISALIIFAMCVLK